MQYQCMSTYCDIVSYTHFATKNGGITTNGHIMWHQFLQLPVTGSLLPPDLAVKFMFICITLLHRIPANWRNWSVKWLGQKWNGAPVPGVAVFTIKIEESWP